MSNIVRYSTVSLLLSASLLILASTPTRTTASGVLTVTRLDDPVPDGCLPGDCSLREAVIAANLDEPPNEIVLSAGTYSLSLPGGDEEMSATGDLDINADLSLQGAGTDATIIDGDGQDRVLQVSGVNTQVTVRDLTITGGLSDEAGGGGIWNSGELTVQTSRVTGNDAPESGGGGLYNRGALTVEQTTVDSNQAMFSGGGIFNQDTGVLEVIQSTISDNLVDGPGQGGGGIRNTGFATITNSTVSGNTAAAGGAGVQGLGEPQSHITIQSSTIAENHGADALRIVGVSSASIVNAIVAGNDGDQCFVNFGALLSSHGHNAASDGTCELTSAGDLPNTDAMLGPLADNGGLTRTHRLLAGSPAIDAGDTSECPDFDQRGRPRFADCDIGAYEFGGRVWGDGDCSGQANPVDALQVLRYDAGLPISTPGGCFDIGSVLTWTDVMPQPVRWGDNNCSEAADPVDALWILRYDAGLGNAPVLQCPEIGAEVTLEEPEQIVMDDNFFDHEGETNPDIEIAADSQVLFAVPNEGSNTHNLHVDVTGGGFSSCAGGDICTNPEVVPPGLEAGLQVDLPAGTYDFQCDFHPTEMTGRFIVD